MPQVAGGVDEARHFLSAQYDGDLPTEEFGKGHIIAREAPLQGDAGSGRSPQTSACLVESPFIPFNLGDTLTAIGPTQDDVSLLWLAPGRSLAARTVSEKLPILPRPEFATSERPNSSLCVRS